MRSVYEEYAILEAQIAEIELKKEQLRTVILKNMTERGENKIDTPMGSFSVQKRKKWTYPEYVNELEEELKTAQEKAKSTNEATYEETSSLRFTQIKL